MSKRTNNGGDYDIGHSQTPEYTRFKKGQSGNPKGRPKKEAKEKKAALIIPHSEQDELLRSQLERKVSISEGGKRKKMKMREIISQAQVNAAAKGNVYAQREILKTARELELRDAERATALVEEAQIKRENDVLVYNYMVGEKRSGHAFGPKLKLGGKSLMIPSLIPTTYYCFPSNSVGAFAGLLTRQT